MTQEKALQALHSENERLGLYKDAYVEPVAWVCMKGEKHDIDFDQPEIDAIPVGTFLYTTPPQRTEQNFCSRCGKRLGGINSIHTCTPPMEKNT